MLKASVIIPTYNRAYILKHCLSYLLNQTTNDYEIIVIDDASQDETPEQVSSLKSSTGFCEQVSSLTVVDCALIYEWRINNWFDKIILVASDYPKKLQRLMNSGCTQKEAEDRIHAQLPDSEKKKTADWIIENNSNLRTLEQNAKRIWDSIVNRKS